MDIDTSLNVDGTVTDDGAVHDGDVTFTGASYNVVWDKSDNALEFADNAKATFGAGGDLSIYHDGSNSYINDTATGNLKLAASQVDILGGTDGAETMATFVDNGAATLYYDNTARIATTSAGVDVTGTVTMDGGSTSADFSFGDDDKALFGAGNDLQIYHDGSNSYILENGTGNLIVKGNAGIYLRGTNDENMATLLQDGAVTLYHDNSSKLATTSSGVDVTGAVNPTTGITLADNVNLTLGTGSDATIDFSGSNLEIRQANDAQDTYFYDASGNARLRLDTDQGDLHLYNYDSDTDGPNLILKHLSGSPADNDALGRVYFVGDNSADEVTYYTTIYALAEDVTDGSEDGSFFVYNLTDGDDKEYFSANYNGDKAVRLSYDGTAVLATTSAGVTITGDLDASGSIFARGAVGSYSETGLYLSNEGSSVMQIGAWRSGASAAELAFAIDSGSDSAPVEKMRLDSSGRLGIGTSSPASSIHLHHSTPQIRFQDSDGTSQYTNLYQSGGIFYIQVRNESSNGVLSFRTYDGTTNLERMRMTSLGRLGIGTSSPTTRLQIGDNTVSSENVVKFGERVATSQTNLPLIGQHSYDGAGNGLGINATSSGGAIHFFTGNDAAGFGTGSNAEQMRISAAGIVSQYNQPAFQVLPSANQSDIAINTWTTIVLDSERFDVGGNFAGNTFTAPVTGKYMLTFSVRLENVDAAANHYYLALQTSNEIYYNIFTIPGTVDVPYLSKEMSIVADMDASDTAYLRFYQSGGTAQTDIDIQSWFSGYLLG